MTIDLSKITSGRKERPPRVVIYGPSGVGKTRFAVGAPDPFVIDADRGSHAFETRRVVPGSWTETTSWLTAIETGQVKCKTVILDSVTALENMSHEELFRGSSIDKYEGGYGKGDTYALMAWRDVLGQLERLWNQGHGIVIVAHVVVKPFADPMGVTYDRLELACRPKLAGLITQWSDYVLMAREEISTQRDGQKHKATTNGVRWAYTKRCPAYDAKARGTSMFPERILLSWDAFADAVKNDSARLGELGKEIDGMLAEIADETFAGKVREFIKTRPEKLMDARNRVAAKLEEVLSTKQEESHA